MYLEREAPPLAFLRAPLQISSNSLNSSYKSLFFFQAEDGIRDHAQSRGLGDVYKRQVHNNTTNNQHPGLFFEEEEELFPLAQPYGDIFGCDQFQNEFDILRNYSSFGNNNASSVSNANQNYNANSLLNKRQRDLYDEFNEFEEICNGALRKARGGASLSRYMDLFDEQKTQDTHQAFTWLNDEGLDSKPKTNFY
eukprot:TRINITY_DN7804_c0_g1_i1.p1 TRINITY_DN7804_c0_g1~~TRINITY_DN7804_c0_g1_i1.p1  ORF type:complete len:195 (-),score=74.75 TRINITY_DN7804_c0_g1_i1:306-890(-)